MAGGFAYVRKARAPTWLKHGPVVCLDCARNWGLQDDVEFSMMSLGMFDEWRKTHGDPERPGAPHPYSCDVCLKPLFC